MLLILRLVKRFASLAIILAAVASVLAATALTVVPQVSNIVTSSESTAATLELGAVVERSSMYAADGTFLTYLARENSEPVSLDDIPQPVIDAVLAMEDADFYQHDGVNYRAIFRALVENINAGGIEQGGSTITQQLVKLSFLSADQNFDRKSTEAFYALRLEEEYTKDEILERYLNTVYFGANSYGVRAAAETYWGMKDVSELGWAEAAMLAGLIRNPNGYNPTVNAVRARDRRNVVVDRLLSQEVINENIAEQIRVAPLPAERAEPYDLKPTDYFVEEALNELLDPTSPIPLGDDQAARYQLVYFGGLEVHTTFDPRAQAAALAARAEHLPEDERGFTVAIASVDTKTSAVRAMVGGPDFQLEAFNLTTDGVRQPGSSMKTFVLAALFEAGYTPRDTVRGDSPCEFKNPGGYPDPYEVKGGGGGVQSIASATRSSNNCAFVRLGQVVGNDKVIEVATRLGITTLAPEDAVLSLPLGSKEVHPMEIATAYAAMANDGIVNDAYYVQTILDRDGNVLYEHRPDPRRAISTQSARLITETLVSNVVGGTGQAARLAGGHEAGGKTGTAQNYEDAWFVGFTTYLTTAVWMGHPDEKIPMRNVPGWGNMFGGKVPATIWGAYNNVYHENLEPVPFAEPESYGGGRYLKVDGEIDFCNSGDRGGSTSNTVMVDSDGDGEKDCFNPVTTTTETTIPETTLPDPSAPSTTVPPTPAPTAPPSSEG
ncbi:MAG: transglycosylase domain-containing protein [Acidimicrobiales bacterium]